MTEESVLIIAAWGYPPSWQEAEYRLKINHPRFRNLSTQTYTCRSSTIALASHLLNNQFKTRVKIFGLDSVVEPTSNYRERIEESYRGWIKEILGSCENRSIESENIEIYPCPAIGTFHGWRFNGSIDHIFNKVYMKTYEHIEDYTWVFLDLTHGLNYQTIATLYGVLAACITRNREDRLIMMNSTPPPGGKKQKNNRSNRSQLDLIDVSRLKDAITILRAFTALRNLEYPRLKFYSRHMDGQDSIINVFENDVKPFISLLRNGVVAMTYPRAFINNNQRIIREPCEIAETLDQEIDVEYRPEVDYNERMVNYPNADVFHVVGKAASQILRDLCIGHNLDLTEYMEKAGEMLRKSGLTASSLQVKREAETLKNIVRYLNRSRGRDHIDEGITSYSYAILRRLENIEEVLRREVSQEEFRNNNRDRLCDKDGKTVRNILENLRKNIDEVDLRNLTAHAGLSYTLIEHIKLGNDGKPCAIRYRERALDAVKKLISA